MDGGDGTGAVARDQPQASPSPSAEPDISSVARLLGPVITLFAIAISLSILRLYTRFRTTIRICHHNHNHNHQYQCQQHNYHRPKSQNPSSATSFASSSNNNNTNNNNNNTFAFKPSWDDTTLLLSTVCAILQLALLLAAVPFGLGRHSAHVPYASQVVAGRFLLLSQLPWGWSVSLAKISIACLLLRLKSTTSLTNDHCRPAAWTWKTSLCGLMALQLCSAASANVVQLAQCAPVAAIWDPRGNPGGKCLDTSIAHATIYANGGVAIVSDLFLAAAPVSFLRNVRRSRRERAVLIVLMGLGVFAAAATCVKLTLVGPYGERGDGLWDTVDVATWSCIEAYMGIIAASLPCLKSPFERLLRRMGVIGGSLVGGSVTNGSSSGGVGGSRSRDGSRNTSRGGSGNGHHRGSLEGFSDSGVEMSSTFDVAGMARAKEEIGGGGDDHGDHGFDYDLKTPKGVVVNKYERARTRSSSQLSEIKRNWPKTPS